MAQSWSQIRKKLEEEYLCGKLRGRVQYFFTIYKKAPDQYGRFAVRVDGKERYRANPYNEQYYFTYEEQIKAAQNIPARQWNGKKFLYDEENRTAEEEAARQAIADNKADSYDVMRAVHTFLNQAAELSLQSDCLLLRMFAVLDRRIGKRTLVKLKNTYKDLPEWLKQFYELRLAAEGIEI